MATYGPIPAWLTGKAVATCSIEPLTYDSTSGTLTSTAAVSLIGIIDEVSYSTTQATEMITAMTSGYESEIATEISATLSLTEILRRPTGQSLLANAWENGSGTEYARVVIQRGLNSWTFIGIMTAYTESIRKGRSVARLTLMSVDFGNAAFNPAYS